MKIQQVLGMQLCTYISIFKKVFIFVKTVYAIMHGRIVN